jgi:hypothetical protein
VRLVRRILITVAEMRRCFMGHWQLHVLVTDMIFLFVSQLLAVLVVIVAVGVAEITPTQVAMRDDLTKAETAADWSYADQGSWPSNYCTSHQNQARGMVV